MRDTRGARLIRRFKHGTGGTALVALEREQVVLKAWPAESPTAANLKQAVGLMSVMRARGVPIPEIIECGQFDGHEYVLYERLRGSWPAQVTLPLLRELTDVVELERGAAPDADGDWPGTLRSMLHDDGDRLFEIVPRILERHPGGRRLLADARARLQECDPMQLSGIDIMHGDLAPENMLSHNGRLSGVVDWEQSRPGDANLDLIGVLFDIEAGTKATQRVRARFRSRLRATIPDTALALYVAIYSARYASWAIGTTMEADVLRLANRLTHDFSTPAWR